MSGTWYDATGTLRVPNAPTGSADSWVGTEDADVALDQEGFPLAPLVVGGEGADTMLGLGGDDKLAGGDDNDSVLGGEGNDELYGAAGDDILDGGAGDDFIDAQPGDDTMQGGEGSDTVFFNGAPQDYAWVKVDGGWRVTDNELNFGDDGTDFVADDVEYAIYNNNADPVILPVPCFLPGTLIATPEGERAIETIAVGDLVLTADGRAVPVRFAGRTTVEARTARGAQGLPILIRAGALAEGVPHRDLYTSPHHGVVVEGVLVFAQALVNGLSILRMGAPAPVFVYHNLETEAHEVVLANGAPVETFCDNIGREAFDNHAEFLALYPEGRDIGEMALPHAKSARQVPRAILARIEARALARAGDVVRAA
jgi:Ca2+-binding RTX toxin-like protein